MFEQILFQALSPILDRIGKGWKSALGLFLMAALLAVQQLGWLGESWATTLWHGAEILFGIGVIDKFRTTAATNGQAETPA